MSAKKSSPVPIPAAELRPLPARPNLEFERKRAKKLLAEMRRTSTKPVKLADAQFAIAREYGFMNWPLLVRYYDELARQEQPDRPSSGEREAQHHDQLVQAMLRMHQKRIPMAALSFATFIPRFFGHSIASVMDSEVTLDDARLVIAREQHAASWEALRNRPVMKGNTGFDYFESWRSDLRAVFKNRDLALLQKIVEEHPEVLDSRTSWRWHPNTLADSALQAEIVRTGRNGEFGVDVNGRKISDWLMTRGVDFSAALAKQLIGWQMMKPEAVQYWLDRGADPNFLPPNGIPILEHAAYRYMNGAALDLLAKRVTPRKRFWLAAALGDVRVVARYFRPDGSLTDAARRNRPDFSAIGPGVYPHAPGAEDEYIIHEAFFVAAMNGRYDVLDLLFSKGYPIDHNIGWPMLNFAVNMSNVSLVEFLVSRGANVDVEDWHGGTARKRAEMHWYEDQKSETTIRMLKACSDNDPQEIIRAYDAVQPKQAPGLAPMLTAVFELARISASRNGRKEVEPEDVFIGLLSEEHGMPLMLLSESGVNVKALRGVVGERLVVKREGEASQDLPLSSEVNQLLQRAMDRAGQMKHYRVGSFQILAALIANESGKVAETLRAAGGDIRKIVAEIEKQH